MAFEHIEIELQTAGGYMVFDTSKDDHKPSCDTIEAIHHALAEHDSMETLEERLDAWRKNAYAASRTAVNEKQAVKLLQDELAHIAYCLRCLIALEPLGHVSFSDKCRDAITGFAADVRKTANADDIISLAKDCGLAVDKE